MNEYHNLTAGLSNNVLPSNTETSFEFCTDAFMSVVFIIIAVIASQRISMSRRQSGGTETTVVTAFYSLILVTSILRTMWFFIPKSLLEPSYVPSAVMAFEPSYPCWFGVFISEVLLSTGSLGLFSIFILILVYWADILKKYFYPGARRPKPMTIFIILVTLLVIFQFFNGLFFLTKVYSSEGMILINAIMLALISVICVCEITIFSHRFRTVLKTLGAINQVSTESQVKRILWITVTGNIFFFTRAFLETIFALKLIIYWRQHGNLAEVFSHKLWDIYVTLKYWSEVAILSLMLYILQSRFKSNNETGEKRKSYAQVPDTEDVQPVVSGSVVV